MVTPRDPLVAILGPKAAKTFAAAFEIETVGDLLRHYPRRYHHRGELTDLGSLRDGEHVTVLAQVVSVRSYRMTRRRGDVTEIVVTDGAHKLTLTFFSNSSRRSMWHHRLQPGTHGLFSGEVSTFRNKRQLVHPDCEVVSADEAGTAELFWARS